MMSERVHVESQQRCDWHLFMTGAAGNAKSRQSQCVASNLQGCLLVMMFSQALSKSVRGFSRHTDSL